MVFEAVNLNLREASCCSVLVINGAGGLRVVCFFVTFFTLNSALSMSLKTAWVFCSLSNPRSLPKPSIAVNFA